MNENLISADVLGKPPELPCGVISKNRLVKAPMSDSLGNGEGGTTEALIRLYEKWAEGEVQGDPRFPEKTGNLVLGPNTKQQPLLELTRRATIEGAHLWPQLGHAGALSHLPISRPKGPSALHIGNFECAGMSNDEVKNLERQKNSPIFP